MSVTIIDSTTEMAVWSAEWCDFLDRDAGPHDIRQHPEFLAHRIEEKGGAIEPFIVVVRRDGTIVALAPFGVFATRYAIRLGTVRLFSIPFRYLLLFGNNVVTKVGEDLRTVMELIFRELATRSHRYDSIRIEELNQASSLAEVLREGGGVGQGFRTVLPRERPEKTATVEIQGSFDEYLSRMTRKTRYNLKRQVKKLFEKPEDEATVARITNPGEVEGFLEEVNQVFPQTWQAKSYGLRPRNDPASRRFFEALARRGWFRSYILRVGGKPVAFAFGYQYRGVYSLSEIGYDRDVSRLGVGTVLNFKLVEDLFNRDPPEVLDFGAGEAEYKRILGTHERQSLEVHLLARRALRARSALYLQKSINRGQDVTKRILGSLGLYQRLRRALRRRG